MMTLFELLLAAAAVILAVPVTLLFVEIACAVVAPASDRARVKTAGRAVAPRLAILMPAHDEAEVIGATLGAIREQLSSRDRLIVVADNCTDDTAGNGTPVPSSTA